MVTWGGPGTASVAAGPEKAAVGEPGERDAIATISDQLGPSDADEHDLPEPTSRTRSGTARQVVVPGSSVTVEDLKLKATYPVSAPTELPEGEYLATIRSGTSPEDAPDPTTLYVRFDGPASLEPDDSSVSIAFWDRTAVTAGCAPTRDSRPSHVTVEPTPGSIARGLSHLSAAHRTTGPARSHPGLRDHPPLLTIGDETRVPSRVREARADTGLTLTVPDALADLFVAAPLAYYLGARIEVDDVDEPRLRGESGLAYGFDPLPAFQHQCAQLLRRVFYLDCQVRRVAAPSDEVRDELAAAFDLDSAAVRTGSVSERLSRYLDVPDRDLDRRLPDWHLSTYVAPVERNVRSLPYLLDRLSLVYAPQARSVDRSELLESTLSAAFPTRGVSESAEGVVQAIRQAGQTHAWLAPGTPLNAFELTTESLETQLSGAREREQMRVTVVLNDETMEAEHGRVADIYRSRASKLPIDVTVRNRLTRGQLADVFEAPTDFVHYIGHCDDAGLRCPDGNLDVAALERSRARTFFLNACGSHEQGRALVENGSIAGAVTIRTVLDRQAARVGTAFARLLVHGFSFERALGLARRRILMGKDYAVVGDGTYALLPSPKQPTVVRVTETSTGRFDVTCAVVNARTNGARYRTPFDDRPTLNGDRIRRRLDRSELRAALDGTQMPVVYDGDVHWSDDLADEL